MNVVVCLIYFFEAVVLVFIILRISQIELGVLLYFRYFCEILFMKSLFVTVFTLVVFLFTGCQPNYYPIGNKKTEVKIKTPGVEVKVKTESKGKKYPPGHMKKEEHHGHEEHHGKKGGKKH